MSFNPNLILILGVFALAGCEREDPIVSYKAPRQTDPVVPSAQREQADAGGPQWDLPEGWVRLPEAGPMRYASIAVTPDGSLQLAIGSLPQQRLAPNINRWEDQVSLPPTPEEQVNSVVKHMDGDHGTHFDVVDLKGAHKQTKQPHQMLAALLNHGGKTWSFKIEGAPELVAPQKEKFEKFLRSVRFGGAGAPSADDDHDHPAPPRANSTPAPSAKAGMVLGELSLPSDWRLDPKPREMREKTILVGNTTPPTEVVISRFAMNFSLPMNLDRWRRQVELGPATPEEMSRYVPQSMTMGGHAGSLFDVVGPNQRQLVAMASVGGELWFVKMLGPKETVNQQEATFRAFVNNLRFQ